MPLQTPASDKTEKTVNKTDIEDKKLKSACKDFESVFLGYILKGMRKTVSKSELLDSSNGEEIFQGMMDDAICKSAAETESIGIADMLYNQLGDLIKQQDLRGENP